jgi:hypothetical protein
MFEKSRASNMTAQVNMIPASLVLSTGETLSGNVTSTGPGRLIDVLNAPTAFIEFHTHDGEIRHINKSAVISLAQPDLPRTDQLARRNADAAAFDPYAVLGVNRDATPDAIREAFIRLARLYHPDSHASATLPGEVSDYICAMAKRINAAWDILSRSQQQVPVEQV